MAFRKIGGFVQVASLVKSPEDWFEAFEPFHPKALTTKTAARIIEGYSPDEYLFSHNTIIASVDVDPEMDHMITAESQSFINDNVDAWERGVIANDWSTFVGAENYLEHVQIPHLSKGKIIDGALRDVGDSLYVDILVATAKKHERLIQRIQTGDLNAMSMGCICDYTVCSKCGNKAKDEVQLCNHIRWAKGNVFIGPDGHQRKIAELCGHRDDPGSVKFIEASWVANPAFRGAVTRNLLSLPELERKAASSQFFLPSPIEQQDGLVQRAATKSAADEPVMDHAENYYKQDDTLPEEAQPKNPDRSLDEAYDYLYYDDNPSQTLEKEYDIGGDDRPFDVEKMVEKEDDLPLDIMEENIVHSSKAETLEQDFVEKYSAYGFTEEQLLRIREGLRYYRDGGFKRAAQSGFKGIELLSLRYFMEKARPTRVAYQETPVELYGLVKVLNGMQPYASKLDFLKVAAAKLGRKFKSKGEVARLVSLAKLFDLGES